MQASDARTTLKPSPRALYIELKRRFTGNNGRIILSHLDAASAPSVHRNAVGPWFDELQDRAFICMTQAPHLAPSGIGQTSQWALEELPCDDLKTARKGFMSWRHPPPHKKQDTSDDDGAIQPRTVLKIVT